MWFVRDGGAGFRFLAGERNFSFSKLSKGPRTPPSLPVNRYIGGFSLGGKRPGPEVGLFPSEIGTICTSTATYVWSWMHHSVGILALRSDIPQTFGRSMSKLLEELDSLGRMVMFVISPCVIQFSNDVCCSSSLYLDLHITSSHLHITPSHLHITPSHLHITPSHLQITPSHLHITPSYLQITPSHLQITPSHLHITPSQIGP
jgi:hypothetical protein